MEAKIYAIGFAYEGARFANSNLRITFENLIEAFELANNPGLRKLCSLIRTLEGIEKPVAETAGVETLLQGARRRCATDEELLFEAKQTFDLLFAAYSSADQNNIPV